MEQIPLNQQVTDEDWERLTSPSTIASAMKAAEKKYGQLSSDEIGYLRNRAKTDRLFLGRGILGYDRLSAKLHGSLCRWLSQTEREQFRLILLPRSHFKTTVVTITDSIQIGLPPDSLVTEWPRNLGPNVRILLAHEAHEGASRFLYEITSHFCNNPALMGLYPECVPMSRIQRMNKHELELPRTEFWAEPTYDTIGVGGRSQGRHYNHIKLDDLFGDKARDSKAERDATIQWFDNIQSFLIRLARDRIDLIGTRYSLNDLYAHAIQIYGDRMKKYIRRIREVNPETGLVEPIFPEEFTDDSLAILKKNPKVWAAQYVNDPQEGLAEFDPAWKKYYYWAGKNRVASFIGTSTAPTSYEVRDLDICILVDPAVTGKSGVLVTGTDDKLRTYILEAIKGVFGPNELINLMFKLVQRWWPRAVAIEEVIFSAYLKPWLEREMMIRNCRFNIIPVKPRKISTTKDHSKIGRVKALANYFSAGQILFNEGQKDLIEEYDNFGATDDYHMLDALAYGPDIWRKGLSAKQFAAYKKIEEDLFKERDPMTGYSV